ncbi:MAG: NAD(P)-dependent oxidoreductase [Chthoniobacterales bacterium]|nr:NAD(P)-dependent oxidoreductase [Chthoniobacterales bacterium]
MSPQKTNTTTKQTIGLIGLGIIGSRVALLLRRAGYPLFVWNRTPRAEPNFLPSVTEIAEAADTILLFVRDGSALLEVLRELSPSLTARHLIINHATVSPQQTLEAAQLIARRGASFLEAPFTGSRDAATAGALVYFIGGTEEILRRARPVLEVSSKKIMMIGETGTASYIKIATNIILGAEIEILAEALAFLRMGDVPLQRLGEALGESVAHSEAMAMKLPLMLQGDFEPRFSVKNMLKDLQLALTLVKEQSMTLPATAATAQALQHRVEAGLGDADVAAVATQYDYPGNQELFSLPAKPFSSQEMKAKQKTPLPKKRLFFSFWRK